MTHAQLYAAPRLSAKQISISIIMGVILWFAAALLLRFLGQADLLEQGNMALLYALVIPGTVPFVYLIRMVASIQSGQLGPALAIATAAAALCDGMALTWLPQLYGETVEIVAISGASILWGAGVAIALGFLLDRRAN
ncbi:hypothetical protein [Alterisphingorhabdus coralli]|uniref:Uncharacterized protein n=1 Tax=Alterisphingorhabdus coralli TaxID=3071408 RepID=A0AA97I0R8_9SPHN|nr:hypothetical protein [Parasphingorhabdus sp. SCSIO 66989]WOE74490.1 hypothetical protein RB602_11610 [Parasphingorhabdus sp. SCSIO 66989]